MRSSALTRVDVLGVLSADDDHLVCLTDPAAHSLAPDFRVARALGAAQHRETGARAPGLREKQFVEFPVVLDIEADEDIHDALRERRNARYFSNSSSSSAVRSSIAKAANLLRRRPPSCEGSKYPAFSINDS